ncbi:MAG: hypothetical protein IPN93_00430 [Bacteroidetes bacterium]|jgi:hypothetical protein|nr:hypothetical protein [Bacteroidota bacterium]MBL0077538.1 hypothetical protein [Bacteroidota bacterium]MBL0286565.1 hypothetical protein [Bacteroidota bacterium]
MKKDLEIICLYRSNQGREVNYNTLVSGIDVMDLEDYVAENFWQTMGGLEITKDGNKTIFKSTDFYNIVKPINFILHSLYKIRNINCDWFDNDESDPSQIILQTAANDILKLKLLEKNTLSLSYLPLTKETKYKRGKHYFADEIISIETWVIEAEMALKEYFETLSKVTRESDENNTVKIMKEYLDVFKNICPN